MRRILVTEDSATMRSLLIATIESCGDYEVVEAASGFEALRLLPREHIDLIITDINMPDINGLELIRYVRNNSNYTTTPLFIISTEGREKDVSPELLDAVGTQTLSDAEIETRIAEMEAARRSRNFQASDAIRAELTTAGLLVEITKDGVRWRRK